MVALTDVLAKAIHELPLFALGVYLFLSQIHADKFNTWFLIYQQFLKPHSLRAPPYLITGSNI